MNKRFSHRGRQKKTGNQRGFSLVELVASLVIAGILAVALLSVVSTAMDGYVFGKNAADISQKAQLSLARMRCELLNATAITTATADRIAFSNRYGNYILERTGGSITLEKTSAPAVGAKTLVDGLPVDYGSDRLFTFAKVPSAGVWTTADDIADLFAIDITLKFNDYNGTFQTTVNPRGNRLREAPRML